MISAGEVAAELSRLAGAPVTAGALRAVVERGQALDLQVAQAAAVAGGDEGERLVADAARTDGMLQAAAEAIDHLSDGDTIPRDSVAWARSVGPIMLGRCPGEPWCPDDLARQWGGAFAQAPWGAQPWVLASALGELQQARQDAWDGLWSDLQANTVEVAEGAAEAARTAFGWGKLLAIGAGIWWLTKD